MKSLIANSYNYDKIKFINMMITLSGGIYVWLWIAFKRLSRLL